MLTTLVLPLTLSPSIEGSRFAYPYRADLDGHIEREYHPGN